MRWFWESKTVEFRLYDDRLVWVVPEHITAVCQPKDRSGTTLIHVVGKDAFEVKGDIIEVMRRLGF